MIAVSFVDADVFMSLIKKILALRRVKGISRFRGEFMARVTVEDSVVFVPDRFELVVLAAQRARDIGSGASLTVERDNDRNSVVALREIAVNTLSLDGLREAVLGNFQCYVEAVDSGSDLREFLYEEEKAWVSHAALEEGFSSEALSEDGVSSDATNLYS